MCFLGRGKKIGKQDQRQEGAGRRKGQGQGNRTLAHPFAMADDNNHFECLPHFQRTQLGCVCLSLSVCVCVCMTTFSFGSRCININASLTPKYCLSLSLSFFHYTKLFNFLQTPVRNLMSDCQTTEAACKGGIV